MICFRHMYAQRHYTHTHTLTNIYIENKPQSTNLLQLPMLQRLGGVCGITKWQNRETRESQKPSNQQVRRSKSNVID